MATTAWATRVAITAAFALLLPSPAQAAPATTFHVVTQLNGVALPHSPVSGSASAEGSRFTVNFAGANATGTETVVSATWKTVVPLTGQWCIGRLDGAYLNHRIEGAPPSFLLSFRIRPSHARTWTPWFAMWREHMREATPDIDVVSGVRETCVLRNGANYRGPLHVEMRLVALLKGTRRVTFDTVVSLAEDPQNRG